MTTPASRTAAELARAQIDYIIALQRAIEYHCEGKSVPEWIAKECPFHAQKLNYHLTQSAPPAAPAVSDGWQDMTAEAMRIQQRHLDNHDGDVYHAMQALIVRFGKPWDGVLVQSLPPREPPAAESAPDFRQRSIEVEQHDHKTVPVRVWVDVDEGIAKFVETLNKYAGLRTHASCQGVEGRYPPQVMCTWIKELDSHLHSLFQVTDIGECFGYLHPPNAVIPEGYKDSYATPRAEPQAAMNGWLPIETAPKDGMRVDLWLCSCIWLADGGKQVAAEFRVADACWNDGWTNPDGNSLELEGFEPYLFTHWMHQPFPPVRDGGAG